MISQVTASSPQPDIFEYFQIQLDEGNRPDQEGVHTHPFHEIIYCHSNSGAEFLIGDYHYHLRRGDIILLPPETPHTWLVRSRAGEPYMGYRLCAKESQIAQLRPYLPKIEHSDGHRWEFIRTMGTVWEQHTGAIFQTLYEESHFRFPGWETAAMASIVYLLIQLGRAMIYAPGAEINEEKNDLSELVVAYVKSNLAEKITLENIAQCFWVSPSTITNVFNKKFGTSFYKYVTILRLNEAKNLISEDMPMEKVAAKVGFGDYSAFFRAFKKEFGISPRQYQQSLKH